MEKRIELEKRARKANQITELNLDNCRSTNIVGLTDEYTALETLSLINVGLTTLKGFPKLPNLKKLELSDNRISNGLNHLTTSTKLQYLNLSGNKIKDLETLEPLQQFKHLSILDLFNNEATHVDNYREKIFEMLPSLKYLDGFDCNDVEAPSDGEDDEEVNGNDSEDDDKQSAFCLNGLEIDLAELEALEQRVEAKRKNTINLTATETNETAKDDEDDDLDLYLAQLKLKEAQSNELSCDENTTKAVIPHNGATTTLANVNTTNTTVDQHDNIAAIQRSPINFAILLYWFLAILNLAQVALYSEDGLGEEEDDGEQNDDDDASLDDDEYNSENSEVVSDDDDVDDEDSDFGENDDGEDDDEDIDSDEDEAAGAVKQTSTGAKDGEKVKQNAENASAEAAESQARGKKRKHDG